MSVIPANTETVLPESVEEAAAKPNTSDTPGKPVTPGRRSTSHLKLVPDTLELREKIKAAAEVYAKGLDRSRPFNRAQLETFGRDLLDQMELPEAYLGFAMVLIGNYFWKKQFLALPFNRRMLLLPHCLKHADGCPAEYDEFGLDCEKCGACSIADYKVRAEQLGYKVLVAEGSPVVLKIIVSGHIDGILGVACLNVLEKAIDKVLLAGVPSFAVPLHSGDCKNTKMDEPWVWECLDKYEPMESLETAGYVPLMRAANRIFDEQIDEVLPKSKALATSTDPLGPATFTEAVSRDALIHGGKRLRPFVTLAVYHALTQDAAAPVSGVDSVPLEFPLGVRRVAAAMEAFHKASLVHDDIEDGDDYRYGRETLHHKYDVGTAINVGDHLIGLGYRLLTQAHADLEPDQVADLVDRLASAHLKLCEGQGAELRWTGSQATTLTPLEAMKIYALKTSPAFEAALFAGVRLAGPSDKYNDMIPQFCRHVGVGFQILNDLKDWDEGIDNKKVAGRDAELAKPTLLLAMALEAAAPETRRQLEEFIHDQSEYPNGSRTALLRKWYTDLGIFEKSEALVDKCRARAEALADAVENEAFRQLLYFIIDTVLARETASGPPASLVSLNASLHS
ncbi:polyprenyl synthetase family protein [Planctomicrobium sp. SH668]|uniref:polyprenyl synthetase family protein n=1 Tax=Planctomicrobium sp. SH668 TaxID=3448126 RepID=UPI003F5BEDCE